MLFQLTRRQLVGPKPGRKHRGAETLTTWGIIRLIYDIPNHPHHLPFWQAPQVHRERTANLIWPRDHCGGLFPIVGSKPKTPT